MFLNVNVVNVLRLFWVIIVLWYEVGVFYQSVDHCHWPDTTLIPKHTSETRALDTNPRHPFHILLVADPQILDHRSYDGRSPLLVYLTRLAVDLNLRKNWRAALTKKPDAVIFLGDMMDGGRIDMLDEEFDQYHQRFRHIFQLPTHIPAYFVPGNHDIGLRVSSLFSPQANSRFISHFGPLNYRVTIANHTLVFLDAPTLVEEDHERTAQGQTYQSWVPVAGGPIEFVKKVALENSQDPVVLISHIPLARENLQCGPLREKGTIRPGRGFGYENTLGKEATNFLLYELKPSVVFSGDDHDYCENFHTITSPGGTTSIREVSIKSLSMAMGIRQPGFQLLSLAPQNEMHSSRMPKTFADAPCFLPDQLAVYLTVYIPLIVLSVVVVLLSNITQCQEIPKHRLPQPVSSIPRKSDTRRSPACVWSIHLFDLHRPVSFGVFFCAPNRSKAQGRRTWVGSCIRDIIDIAIFPLALFFFIFVYLFM